MKTQTMALFIPVGLIKMMQRKVCKDILSVKTFLSCAFVFVCPTRFLEVPALLDKFRRVGHDNNNTVLYAGVAFSATKVLLSIRVLLKT